MRLEIIISNLKFSRGFFFLFHGFSFLFFVLLIRILESWHKSSKIHTHSCTHTHTHTCACKHTCTHTKGNYILTTGKILLKKTVNYIIKYFSFSHLLCGPLYWKYLMGSKRPPRVSIISFLTASIVIFTFSFSFFHFCFIWIWIPYVS